MRTFLITGGCGRKGLHQVHSLNKQGHKVIVYDNLSKAGFSARNLLPPQVEFIFGDVRDEVMLRRVLKDKDITQVLHGASVPTDHSFEDYEVNTGAWLKLQKICAEFDISLERLNA